MVAGHRRYDARAAVLLLVAEAVGAAATTTATLVDPAAWTCAWVTGDGVVVDGPRTRYSASADVRPLPYTIPVGAGVSRRRGRPLADPNTTATATVRPAPRTRTSTSTLEQESRTVTPRPPPPDVSGYEVLWVDRRCSGAGALQLVWHGAEAAGCGAAPTCSGLTAEACAGQCELIRNCHFAVWSEEGGGSCRRHATCDPTDADQWVTYRRAPADAPQAAPAPPPVAHTLPPNVTWYSAAAHCASRGLRLCGAAELCTASDTGSALSLIPEAPEINAEHWTPVADDTNDWIQIGNCPNSCPDSICTSHNGPVLVGLRLSARRGPPKWGPGYVSRGTVFCCNSDECYASGKAADSGHAVTATTAQACQTRCQHAKGCRVFEFEDATPVGTCRLAGAALPLELSTTVVSGPPRCGPHIVWKCTLGTPTPTHTPTQTLPPAPEEALPPVQVTPPGQRINRIEIELSDTAADVHRGDLAWLVEEAPKAVSEPGGEVVVIAVRELPGFRALLVFDLVGVSQQAKAQLVTKLKRGTPPFDSLPIISLRVCYEGSVCDSPLAPEAEPQSPADHGVSPPAPPVSSPSLLPLFISLPIVVLGVLTVLCCWWRRRSVAGAVLPMAAAGQQQQQQPAEMAAVGKDAEEGRAEEDGEDRRPTVLADATVPWETDASEHSNAEQVEKLDSTMGSARAFVAMPVPDLVVTPSAAGSDVDGDGPAQADGEQKRRRRRGKKSKGTHAAPAVLLDVVQSPRKSDAGEEEGIENASPLNASGRKSLGASPTKRRRARSRQTDGGSDDARSPGSARRRKSKRRSRPRTAAQATEDTGSGSPPSPAP
eukprot:TRINITY_DN1064_c1_g1_i1.p1 TRINITY_DN1064_c1_g1~~TRINITY_DN1064_c1_g1_i1.p1  ORF type:complete len:827 (+),score=245.43 TRINITY_DN1064_c1_g1_i1:109-2589(+)